MISLSINSETKTIPKLNIDETKQRIKQNTPKTLIGFYHKRPYKVETQILLPEFNQK